MKKDYKYKIWLKWPPTCRSRSWQDIIARPDLLQALTEFRVVVTDVARLRDLLFSTIGIFSLSLTISCTCCGTPELSLPNKTVSFSKSNDDNLWDSIMERKSDSKYLFYRTRIQFYPRYKYSLEVDQDLDLPTSPEFFKRRFKQMKSVLNL